jgi:hypothetical protein
MNNHTKSIFALVMLAIILLGCAKPPSNNDAPKATQAPQSSQATPVSQVAPTPDNRVFNGLTFSGKIVNKQTNEWMNNRLVLLFLKSKEIARSVTSTGKLNVAFAGTVKYINGEMGVIDGLFTLRIPNTYELSMGNLGINPSQLSMVSAYDGDRSDWMKRDVIANWMDPFYEGDIRDFFIPSKNVKYTVVSLMGPVSDLPAEIQKPNSTEWRDGNRLVAVNPANANATPQPQSLQDGTVKIRDVKESITPFDPIRFPLNNCGGSANLVQRYTKTYIHQVIDETKVKLGVEIQPLTWLKVVAQVESRTGVEQNQVTTFDTTLTVAPGKKANYTIVRNQIWESGIADVPNGNNTISVAYRVLKREDYQVSAPDIQSCP